MTLVDRLGCWLRATLRRGRLESEMDAELRFHLEARAQDWTRSGVPLDEAQRRARLEFGGVESVKEECRQARGVSLLDHLQKDLRFAVRMLRRNPGFTAIAVLTLALGIGANTAIFSVINSVLLEPLPYRDPDRLVRIFSSPQSTGANYSTSGEDYQDWVADNHCFESMTLFSGTQNYNASGVGESETILVTNAQDNFFSVLGAEPQFGRVFRPGEDLRATAHIAVLSFGFAARHFGSAADALGKTVRLDFKPYTVIGVMPPTFNYPESSEAWIPLDMSLEVTGRRGNYSYNTLARLKPGVTLAQARTDMSGVAARLAQEFPITNTDEGTHLMPLKERLTGDARPQLLVLLGAVALVLLVACTNVANLLLARATVRQREIALRSALGASRGRLVRQLLTESILLSFAGALLGLGGAWWLIRFAQTVKTLPLPKQNPMRLDETVLLFTMSISLLVGILFGLAPALEASRPDLIEELRSCAHSVAGRSSWRLTLRNALVVGEIAASLALLVGAGLLLRTFARMRNADIGVRTQHVLTAAVVLPETKYHVLGDRRSFYDRLLERVQHIPGVQVAALSQAIPLEGSHSFTAKLAGDLDPRHPGLGVNVNFVSPDYFRLFGIPFLAGNDFTPEQINRAYDVGVQLTDYWNSEARQLSYPQPQWSTIAIINRTMARQLWPDQDAVGKTYMTNVVQPVTVVGVVADEKYDSIRDTPTAEAYFPITAELDNKWYPPNIVVRTAAAPETVLAAIRTGVQALDPELSLFRVRTMDQVIADNMQDTSLQTVLLGSFAVLGLLLSVVGIYGVMAYLVTQRTHEIGIRMALGAQPSDVLELVLGRGAKLAVAGLALGLAATFALTRLLRAELFGVSASDPLTFGGVALLLLLVALAACYIPSRRAMRVDPLVALHYE
jgi:predicted permease